VDRISEIAGQGLTTLKARAAETARATKAAAEQAAAAVETTAEKTESAAKEAVVAAESKAARETAKVMPSNSNAKQWAKWMADQLRLVPDIGVYGRLRLHDLAEKGPAAAQRVWATAKDALTQDYGNVTVDDLLTEFQAIQR